MVSRYYNYRNKRRRRDEKPSPVKSSTMDKKTRQSPFKTQNTDIFTRLCQAKLRVECVKEYRFHPTRLWRFDYALPAYRIALEVEGGVWTGGRHNLPIGFLRDMEKYNTATLMGWKVFRCVPKELLSPKTLDMLRAAIEQM